MSRPTAQDVSNTAKGLVGIPFVHQGRDRNVGLDCGGVLAATFEALKLPYKDDPSYTLRPSTENPHLLPRLEATEALIRQEGTSIDDIEPGCVLALCVYGRNVPQHCGITVHAEGQYIGTNALQDVGLVHSHTGIERCVEDAISEFWYGRIAAIYRFKGVDY